MLGIGSGDGADHEVGHLELRAQRDDDVARIQGRPGGARKQGRVEHEIGLVDERHARALLGKDALESAGGVETAEAAAGDDYLEGHQDRIGCG